MTYKEYNWCRHCWYLCRWWNSKYLLCWLETYLWVSIPSKKSIVSNQRCFVDKNELDIYYLNIYATTFHIFQILNQLIIYLQTIYCIKKASWFPGILRAFCNSKARNMIFKTCLQKCFVSRTFLLVPNSTKQKGRKLTAATVLCFVHPLLNFFIYIESIFYFQILGRTIQFASQTKQSFVGTMIWVLNTIYRYYWDPTIHLRQISSFTNI